MRKAFLVYVDLDAIPGDMHTQESAQNIVRTVLFRRMAHYNPLVSLVPANLQPLVTGVERRQAFVVYVNLDPMPGIMHTVESARDVIRNILYQSMPGYKPETFLAPADLQPNEEEHTAA